jgi:hypothetical protein
MSDLAWAVKNGDLDQVKEMVEVKVGLAGRVFIMFPTVLFL